MDVPLGGIYLCHKYSGAGLKEIGEKFGIKESAVSQASRRFAQVLERDKELLKKIEQLKSIWKYKKCRFDTNVLLTPMSCPSALNDLESEDAPPGEVPFHHSALKISHRRADINDSGNCNFLVLEISYSREMNNDET
jgi:predicted DNA-binding protein YlxM (UPF0122 family)